VHRAAHPGLRDSIGPTWPGRDAARAGAGDRLRRYLASTSDANWHGRQCRGEMSAALPVGFTPRAGASSYARDVGQDNAVTADFSAAAKPSRWDTTAGLRNVRSHTHPIVDRI
jgi:hypothetical protein